MSEKRSTLSYVWIFIYPPVGEPAWGDALWAKVGDFCNIRTWLPAIDTCTLSNDGKTRTLGVKGGTAVENLISHDDSNRTYGYRAVSGLPLDDYQSTIAVEPATGGSTLAWTGTYKAKGQSDAEAQKFVDGLYASQKITRSAARRFDGESHSHTAIGNVKVATGRPPEFGAMAFVAVCRRLRALSHATRPALISPRGLLVA